MERRDMSDPPNSNVRFQQEDMHEANASVTSLSSVSSLRETNESAGSARARPNGVSSTTQPPAVAQGKPSGSRQNGSTASSSSSHLSGLMCNVHRTTGKEPHPMVGSTTTILGDKLYVFGGRILSGDRSQPLTADLYELDLVRRHWTKLRTTGDVPPPRYFHSMCALGDTKLVCYGGMSPVSDEPSNAENDPAQPEITVMSDVHVYDVTTMQWTYVPAQDSPQGRYAHCACILPSSATFSSHNASHSALRHNLCSSADNPNEGRIGINIDGAGGAEMVIVGGQDGANHYIEQISVFNLRSLKWTSTESLGKSCGAYRSVAAPLPAALSTRLGHSQQPGSAHRLDASMVNHDARELQGCSMLVYSNYNFLDVKLELQVRSPDGTLSERPMSGSATPPGLRFPNGGVIDTHFIVSGTYLTSSKQEYALWALDLRTMNWTRIDAGGSVFSQGSWNRGVLWHRRNTFVVLGHRKRSLVDDYNHRRINFSNVCMVELEAFGFYDNPRKTSPLSGFISASSPYSGPGLSLTRKAGYTAGGRYHSRASEELGEKALAMRELADMSILCIGGEKIAVNSRIVARRWGPYFVQLLREGAASHEGSDSVTLRSGLSSNPLRASALTITPASRGTAESIASLGSTIAAAASSTENGSTGPDSTAGGWSSMGQGDDINPATINTAPTPRSLPPSTRPRCLYLPHTYLTVQALLQFLYTSSLPPPSSPLCTPQILCSLLQIARPYRVDGLLEAVVERLHALLDNRNAAAVFNATAMAAGGGRGIDGSLNPNYFIGSLDPLGQPVSVSDFTTHPVAGSTASTRGRQGLDSAEGTVGDPAAAALSRNAASSTSLASQTADLRINTSVGGHDSSGSVTASSDGEMSASSTVSMSDSEWKSTADHQQLGEKTRSSRRGRQHEVWDGELSSVIGLQKRGLRGLMEGRRMRERTGTGTGAGHVMAGTQPVGSQRTPMGMAGP